MYYFVKTTLEELMIRKVLEHGAIVSTRLILLLYDIQWSA